MRMEGCSRIAVNCRRPVNKWAMHQQSCGREEVNGPLRGECRGDLKAVQRPNMHSLVAKSQEQKSPAGFVLTTRDLLVNWRTRIPRTAGV